MGLKSIAGICAAGVLTLGIGNAEAALLTAGDSTFGTFDGFGGSRPLNIATGGTISDVNIYIDFAKCDDPAMQPNQTSCSGTGEEFSGETYFYLLSPAGTRVDLVYTYLATPEGVAQGTTEPFGTYTAASGGRFQVLFDDQAGAAAGPNMASGSFRPEELLSLFNGEDALGTWTLGMGDSVGFDPLSYFSSRIEITTAPEPATLALFAIGLAGVRASRRRRKQ